MFDERDFRSVDNELHYIPPKKPIIGLYPTLKDYQKNLGHPILTREEESELATQVAAFFEKHPLVGLQTGKRISLAAIRLGHCAAAKKLVRHNQKWVFTRAKNMVEDGFASNNFGLFDAVIAGNRGLEIAIYKFKPGKARLAHYSKPWIDRDIRRTYIKYGQESPRPEYLVYLEMKARKIQAALKAAGLPYDLVSVTETINQERRGRYEAAVAAGKTPRYPSFCSVSLVAEALMPKYTVGFFSDLIRNSDNLTLGDSIAGPDIYNPEALVLAKEAVLARI